MVVVKPFNVGGLYGLESAYGSAVATPTAFGRIQNVGVNVNNNPIKVYGLGAGRNVQASLYGPLDVRFNIEELLHDGDIFKLLIGPKTGSGTAGSPYIFTEATTVATTGIPFFTMETSSVDTTSEGLILAGCVMDSCTINFALNGAARLSFSGVAQDVTNVTASTAYTEVSTKPFIFTQVTVKWGAGPTALGRVVSGNVTIANKLIVYRSLGQRTIQQPEAGLKDYLFSLTAYMSETSYQTLRTSLYGGTSTTDDAVISSSMPTGEDLQILFSEGASSGNRNIQIQFDEATLDSMSEPVTVGNGLVQVSFSGHAHKGLTGVPIKYWTV